MNISTENINTLAQLASSISDGDYVYIYKASSNSFARIEKSLLLQGASGGSGGGGTTSSTVIHNVNTLQAKIDELIGKLANSSFSVSPKPALVGELDWGSEGGGETTTYYNISIATSMKYTISNTATNIEAGQTYTNVIEANVGYDLTSVLVNGVAQTIANNQCTINIVNVSANITVTITAEQQSVDPGTTYGVSVTATDLDVTPNGGTVLDGGTFQCTLALASGVTGKRLPRLDEITISGTHGTATLSNAVLTIPNIQSNITIVASAVATSGVSHSVAYNLTGVNKTSGATSVSDGGGLTAVLAKDSSFNGYYSNKQVHFGARDVIVYMGGQVVSGAATQETLDGDVTVHIPNVTGDVYIMNEVWLAGYVNCSNGAINSSPRSIYSSVLIPIPSGCTTLDIRHLYQSSNNWGCAFYNGNTFINGSGVAFNKVADAQSVSVPQNATHIKLSLYDFTGHYEVRDMYIKDATNNNYIWKGENVQ